MIEIKQILPENKNDANIPNQPFKILGKMIPSLRDAEWAIFNCVGPMPTALNLNTKIFKEWLPNNPEFELDGNANIEWYDVMSNGKNDPNYHSGI